VSEETSGPQSDVRVSVVVPTRDSALHLGACLESIRAQTHRPLELIVVDNDSTDATRQIAERLADLVSVAGPERSAQRNLGARRSSGSFLLFIDSDMILERDVVAECVRVAATIDGDVAVVIPELSFGEGFWARCKALEKSCYLGDETIEAARFFSRAAFFKVGGYDIATHAGEDWDLHERVRCAGARIGRTKAMIYHDEGALRLRDVLATKFYYGKSMRTHIARHPELARRQLRLIRPAFVRNWRLLLADPTAAAGMLAMKSGEFVAGAAGLLLALHRRAA
jgi:glycosyltransferase involved in cell wall biosynthesis